MGINRLISTAILLPGLLSELKLIILIQKKTSFDLKSALELHALCTQVFAMRTSFAAFVTKQLK